MSGRPPAEGEEQLRVQIARLQEQLAEEQLLRRQAEEAVEAVAADRNRLQRARDELATALLMAERRAQEEEEEQLKAEAAAAALAQQLADAQREAANAAAAAGATGSNAADQASNNSVAALAPNQPGQEQAAQQQQQQQQQRGKVAKEGSDAQLARDAEILLAELDRERQRSEELVRMLEAAEHEAVLATDRLMKAQQRIKQLEGKAKGKDSGRDSGLGQSGSAASLEALAGGDAAIVAALQQRIAALKASRDKLIGAFDAQAAEVERLSTDNAALAESLAQLRDVAAKWEAQAQGSLAQNERLKDLLEESATWSIPSTATAAGPAGSTPEAGGAVAAAAALAQQTAGGGAGAGEAAAPAAAAAGGNGAALAALCQRFERELLLEKAKTAQLDLQVRALCMELTRATQSSGQMQAALAPMLGGIEARLVQVLGMRPRPGVLGSAAA